MTSATPPLKVSFQQRPLRAQPAPAPPSTLVHAKTSTSSPSRGAKRPAPPAAVPTPLPSSHIPRTKSELQLREDIVAAEWADLAMFHRLVNGMRDRHQQTSTTMLEQQQQHRLQKQRSLFAPAPPSRGTQRQTEQCINSIICTRQAEQSQQEHNQEGHNSRRRHIVSPETTTKVLPGANDQDQPRHSHLDTLYAALSQAANEDWSLEGYYDYKITNAKEEDVMVDGNEDDADADDGIFSLDL